MISFDRDKGRDNELTPDQACKRLDDPSVPFTGERALLNLCFHPKCMTQPSDDKRSMITSQVQERLWVTYTSIG